MRFTVGVLRMALLLLSSLMLGGCLPSASREEEKEPHFLAGRSRVNTMDFKGAIESFEKALEVNPKSASAHFELGWLFDQKESDPAAAIYHYECYLKQAPKSGKEEMVKTRILACKQQLAQTVSLAPGMEKQQHEVDQLTEENKRLREDLEKWRAYALRLQALTNQAGLGTLASRAPPPSGLSQTRSAAPPADVVGSGRVASATAASTRIHLVKPGETPIVIARKYGVKLEALMAANPRLDPRRMQVGQTLKIPTP